MTDPLPRPSRRQHQIPTWSACPIQSHPPPQTGFRYAGHPGLVSQIISHPTNRIFFSLDWLGQLSAWQTFESREYEYDVRNRKVTVLPIEAPFI